MCFKQALWDSPRHILLQAFPYKIILQFKSNQKHYVVTIDGKAYYQTEIPDGNITGTEQALLT